VARLRQATGRESRDVDPALHDTLLKVGPPSLYTAAILSAGFAVLGLSRFPGFQLLGFLSMLTLLTGFVSDMIFTSTMLKLFFPLPAGPGRLPGIGRRPLEEASS
jgi:predicted RND superfamily exporter protein